MLHRVRTKISDAAAWADGVAMRGAFGLRSWLLWPLLISVAVGSGLWAIRNDARLPTLDTNKLTEPERLHILIGVGAAFGVLCLVYVVTTVGRRFLSGVWRPLETIVTLNKWLFVLFTVPVIAALRLKDVELQSPKLTLFLATLAAALAAVTFYQWPAVTLSDPEPDATPGQRRLGLVLRVIPPLLVLALWAGYGWFFSRLSITNHHALNSRTIDLGYYDNIFYQSIHGKALGCSFIRAGYHGSAHFDPILVLLSPLYLFYPHAEFLLVLQSVWLGAGVVPVYLVTKLKTGSRYAGLLLGLAFVAYPALHGANMYEFHSLTLVTTPVLWLLYFFEAGHKKRYWLAFVVCLLCREDVPLLLCFVGLYEVATGRADGPRTGWLTVALSVAYFAVVKAFFMTSAGIFMTGKDAYSFAYYYDSLIPNQTGLNGLVLSLLTNPIFAVKTMFEEPKIVFLVQLFLPLAFLPFFARRGRAMLVYGLLFCLLASRGAVYSIAFQYTAVLIPIAFVLTPMALRQIEESGLPPRLGLDGSRLSRALLGATLVATLLVSWKFGGFVENAAFRGGFSRVTRTLTEDQKKTYAWVRQASAQIPRAAVVETTNRVGPHVSNRKAAYFYPEHPTAEFLFLDEAEIVPAELEKLRAAVNARKLVEVTRRERLVVYRRSATP